MGAKKFRLLIWIASDLYVYRSRKATIALRLFALLLGLTLYHPAILHGQVVDGQSDLPFVRLSASQDSFEIGKAIELRLLVSHPAATLLVFPTKIEGKDLSFTRKEWYKTATVSLENTRNSSSSHRWWQSLWRAQSARRKAKLDAEGLSIDSAVYEVKTFTPQQPLTLKLPVFLLNEEGDSTVVYSNPVTLRFASVLQRKGVTQGIETETEFLYQKERPDYWKYLLVVLVAILVFGVIWLAFGKRLVLSIRLILLYRRQRSFETLFDRLSVLALRESSPARVEEVLLLWKKHLERVSGLAMSTFTTRDFALLFDKKARQVQWSQDSNQSTRGGLASAIWSPLAQPLILAGLDKSQEEKVVPEQMEPSLLEVLRTVDKIVYAGIREEIQPGIFVPLRKQAQSFYLSRRERLKIRKNSATYR